MNCRGAAARWVSSQNGSADELPVELLHAIFRYVLPPSTLLDPTPSRGPYSPWARALTTKRNLSHVSRHWHSVALSFLYEDISFRHPTQVRALAATLRENPGLARHVKTIVVDCPVTLKIRDALILDLAQILYRCTSLRTLVFTDSPFAMEDDLRCITLYPFPGRMSQAIQSLSESLECFEQWPLGGTPHFTMPISCLAPATRLRKLTINVDHPASLEPVSLPALEELDLSQEYDLPRVERASERFVAWSLPRLRALVLPMTTRVQGPVLAAHGRALAFLEFRDHLEMGTHPDSDAPRHPYIDHLHLCPALRHLVFPARAAANDVGIVDRLPAHPTLAYVDVWLNSPAGDMLASFVERRAARKIAPELRWKNIRVLDRALNAIVALPRLFPPDAPEAELPSVHAIPGLSITHAAWGVYRSDLDVLFRRGDNGGDSDLSDATDSAFEPDSSGSDSADESDDDADISLASDDPTDIDAQ